MPLKIYISSTFEDLEQHRAKVCHRLRELRHVAVAMEDYVAADRRPLEQCLEDVRSSDVYVGILAWRYGYVPDEENPHRKSITELELLEARRHHKPCLLFLLDEKAPWPPNKMDANTGANDAGARIKALRAEAQRDRLVALFDSPDELAAKVVGALYRWQSETSAASAAPPCNVSMEAVVQAEEHLLRGRPRPAVLDAGALAEAALAGLLGTGTNEESGGLGQLLGTAREKGLFDAKRLPDLRWLLEARHSAQCKPDLPEPSADDAAQALRILERLLIDIGRFDAETLARLRRRASASAYATGLNDVLKLDRVHQRQAVADLLASPPPVVGYVADGEVQQGHDPLGQFVAWKLPKAVQGRWRQVIIDWPAPGPGMGMRLAQLIEELSEALGHTSTLPREDPARSSSRAAWDAHMQAFAQRLRNAPDRFFVRHVVEGPSSDDVALLDAYLHRVWKSLGAVPRAGTAVLSFELVRAIPAGLPWLSGRWRVARRERLAAERMKRRVDALGSLPVRTLEELRSVTVSEIAEWLRNERRMPREKAEKDAEEIHAATDGGRFELVLQRLKSRRFEG